MLPTILVVLSILLATAAVGIAFILAIVGWFADPVRGFTKQAAFLALALAMLPAATGLLSAVWMVGKTPSMDVASAPPEMRGLMQAVEEAEKSKANVPAFVGVTGTVVLLFPAVFTLVISPRQKGWEHAIADEPSPVAG